MKYITLLLLLVSFNTFAAPSGSAVKPFTIGAGTYVSVLAFDDAVTEDAEFSGIALSLGYALTDHIAFRGTYFSTENDDTSVNTSKGIDLLAIFGTGMATDGFKVYGGVGFFRDNQDFSSSSETFDGLQLAGGVGYNWSVVALEFILAIRDSSDYEDRLNNTVDIAAGSGSLLLSYRF